MPISSWDNDPAKRPTAAYLNDKLGKWINLICDDPSPSEISNEHSVFEEIRWGKIKANRVYKHPDIHPDAYYTSRFYAFPELSNNMNYNIGKISLFNILKIF